LSNNVVDFEQTVIFHNLQPTTLAKHVFEVFIAFSVDCLCSWNDMWI